MTSVAGVTATAWPFQNYLLVTAVWSSSNSQHEVLAWKMNTSGNSHELHQNPCFEQSFDWRRVSNYLPRVYHDSTVIRSKESPEA
jgi:hypothetical protein